MPSKPFAPVLFPGVGAFVLPDGRTHFRVWAPQATTVSVSIDSADPDLAASESDQLQRLDAIGSGYFAGDLDAPAGSRYRFVLDDGDPQPDPATRFQPEGPLGPSEVIDPSTFVWSDQRWSGPDLDGLVVYEMHVGTFTREGTWRAAAEQIEWLAALGVTAIEMLPVAEFAGTFGWGYDGVCLFAPTRNYGRPDDLRAFVDRAHACGIAVILDVVYNHLGTSGCSIAAYGDQYFAAKSSEWGPSLNFDAAGSEHVRAFVLENVAYWMRDFHFDGLRLDATQQIFDASPVHIMGKIAAAVREAAPGRRTWVVGENEPQHTRLLRPAADDGFGLDALWNDDYHHSAIVAATGAREAYYTDYLGTPQEFISAAKYGFLYQGQHYSWQKNPRGTSARGLGPHAFVCFLQNHDQVANSPGGARLATRTSAGRLRALTALTLLGPWTPMIFQGDEFGATSPFLYFADHEPDVARLVEEGRREFLTQFPSLKMAVGDGLIDVPHDRRTFERSQLDFAERDRHAHIVALHQSLLALRATDATIALRGSAGLDGAVLTAEAFVLRFFGPLVPDGLPADRLLVVNLGRQHDLVVMSDPLLAPVSRDHAWRVIWSSDDPRYGGPGVAPHDDRGLWRLPAESALLLA